MNAGIALDRWKQEIFRTALRSAGFEWTEHPGVTPDTMMFKVQLEQMEKSKLYEVVKAANEKAALQKHQREVMRGRQ